MCYVFYVDRMVRRQNGQLNYRYTIVERLVPTLIPSPLPHTKTGRDDRRHYSKNCKLNFIASILKSDKIILKLHKLYENLKF